MRNLNAGVPVVLEIKTIGETAGLVWNFLRSNGDTSLTALEKGIEAPKAMVSMAVGWLAREGKIELKDEKRAIRISLREPH
jgi:Winged helix-turn-helix domain (DUF2582)